MKSLTELGTRLYTMASARQQKGATIIEYVLLAVLIGVALIATFGSLTTQISAAFTAITSAITAALPK